MGRFLCTVPHPHDDNFHSSLYQDSKSVKMEKKEKLSNVHKDFYFQSLNRTNLLVSLFILLCLTTIHHNINRKVYFQHETYFIYPTTLPIYSWVAEKFEYLLICLTETRWIYDSDSRCHWNIIGAFIRSHFKGTNRACTYLHIIRFLAECARWHWSRKSKQHRQCYA